MTAIKVGSAALQPVLVSSSPTLETSTTIAIRDIVKQYRGLRPGGPSTMSSRNPSDSVFQTPGAGSSTQKRVYTPASTFNFRSHKKRRLSTNTLDVSTESPVGPSPLFQCENISTTSLDRFIPLRPQSIVPLTISPRTNRMYKSFGLLTNQRLNYRDENTNPQPENSAFSLLRKSASSLVSTHKTTNGRSVSQNLARNSQATLVLDSPGLTTSLYSTPLSWSLNNQIAVACGKDIYYQDIDTRKVTFFFTSGLSRPVQEALSIAWGDAKHKTKLACINGAGACEVVCTEEKTVGLALYGREASEWDNPAKSLCWNGDTVTYGLSNGEIRFHDLRDAGKCFTVGGRGAGGHRRSVVSMAYDSTGNFLASGDVDGNVHVWDVRARKSLTEVKQSSKIKHQAVAKALAWCSWQPELLATGSYYPEGTVQVWSTNKLTSGPIEPEKTFALNAAVHSLIWSPQCKELLSTHGVQFKHEPPTHRQRRVSSTAGRPAAATKSKPTVVLGPLTHSMVVHDYPSGKRLLTMGRAHRHCITAACLGPNGQDVFTASPKEETIKMWKVWGETPKRVKERAFADCVIR
ncbi:hypothetical protein D9611_001030 [Ephemerocybe angulata]|uniref:Uncharacterized protein n=1 Tax=Ephemerocybe angulata TaxID=980116 RepID=A0A8H5F717_9AGAR|nr:hypothetical protein D9611_001030 [Tulosesus angulatus]